MECLDGWLGFCGQGRGWGGDSNVLRCLNPAGLAPSIVACPRCSLLCVFGVCLVCLVWGGGTGSLRRQPKVSFPPSPSSLPQPHLPSP